jgi:hypothetical protein
LEGWIKLYRVITAKDIYLKPPLYLRVFERLILEANHYCKRIPYNKSTKLIRRGERLTSVRQIAEWVAWYERGILKIPNPKTIGVILKWLIDNEMIEIFNKGNSQETHYSIVNYSIYQGIDMVGSNAQVTVNGEVSKQWTDTNKNSINKDSDEQPPVDNVDNSGKPTGSEDNREYRLINNVLTDVTGLSQEQIMQMVRDSIRKSILGSEVR